MRLPWLILLVPLLFTNCAAPPTVETATAYAPANSCQGCHAEIAASYRQTGMARAFGKASPALVQPLTSFTHQASAEHYQISERNGQWFLRRHQSDPSGQPINVLEREIHYVLGSGNHARTYLHRRPDGELVELPVGWYAEGQGTHAMSPGYDHRDHPGFRRPISTDCLFCHNGYPNPKTGELATGIDCQRCHGPGQAHVTAASSQKDAATIRQAIYNPKHAPPQRQLELCLQCHLESTSRALPYAIRRFERAPFSYQPHQPLTDFIVHFDFPAGRGPQDHFEIAHHGYRLMQSRCFLASQETMTCTTCHNPHAVQRGPRAFNSACASCHQSIQTHAGKPEANGDCAACHMPQRRTDDVVHVAMTDHKIQRRPAPNLLAPRQEILETAANAYKGPVALSPVSASLSGPARDLYLATAQVYQAANLSAGITALEQAIQQHQPPQPEFYHQLAEAHYRAGNSAAAEKWYREALARDPQYLPGRRNLGATLTRLGNPSAAAEVLKPAANDAAALINLGEALLAQREYSAAEAALRQALARNPDSPEAYNNLATALSRQGKSSDAIQAWRDAIRSRPAYALAHNNLANALAAAGDWPAAQVHFREALRDANYAVARFNYGTALAARGEFSPAETHLRDAIRLDPQMAEAFLNLGNLYLTNGRIAQSLPHFEQALKLRPTLGQARLNLGLAFAELGRFPQARPHLQAAAQDTDPQIRQLAAQALRQLP